jgi:cytochrome c oxidase subunit 3
MAGTSIVEDIELIVDDIGGSGGGQPPEPPGGDDDGDRERRYGPPIPPARRYATAIMVGMVSIVMFFMGMVAAFIFLRATNHKWTPLEIPKIVWFNTAVLLTSSAIIELARRKLVKGAVAQFRKIWLGVIALGILFVLGQLFAWRELVAAGYYLSSTQASSFFYIFTALHGIHLTGGIIALLYVGFRDFGRAKVSRQVAAEVSSYYWHFMDGLWIFLLALLYFGK